MAAAAAASSPTIDTDRTKDGAVSLVEDEEPTSPVGRTTWSSYVNLAKMVQQVHERHLKNPSKDESGNFRRIPVRDFFDLKITATEKVDGSNLGCYVKYAGASVGPVTDPEAWELVLLQGRNAPLYASATYTAMVDAGAGAGANAEAGGEAAAAVAAAPASPKALTKKDIEDGIKKACTGPGYGNAGSLGQLPRHMRAFAVRAAQLIGGDSLTEIEVFGEAFRAKRLAAVEGKAQRQEQVAAFASFHPFGVKLPSQGWKLMKMNAALHQIFTAASAPLSATAGASAPKNHEEFTDVLIKAQDHLVFPPVLYACNEPLINALERLIPLFLASKSHYFEGVFMVFEQAVGGAKFKTGTHCEMATMATLEQIGLAGKEAEADPALARIAAVWAGMDQVHRTKIAAEKFSKAAPVADPGKAAKAALDQQMTKDLTTAVEREFGKMAVFSNVPRDKRQPICDALLPLVIKEVLKGYSEDGVPLPYPEAQLKQRAPGVIKGAVAKVPFDGDKAAAGAAAAGGAEDDE